MSEPGGDHLLRREQSVAAPLDEVFEFFARPENLAELTPPWLGFEILTPPPIPMALGTEIDYVIRLFGMPMRWHTVITDHEPPHRFVDEQTSGPYALWRHTHTFEAVDGGTQLSDEVRYRLPFGPLGRLVHALFVRGRLRAIFDYRTTMIARRFGNAPEESP